MSIIIPTWLVWVGGILGGAVVIWILSVVALFTILGAGLYKAFKNWSWPG